MKPDRRISRRSFLARVSGASMAALAGCSTSGTIEEDPYTPPGVPRGDERPDSQSCTDADSGNRSDPPGNGRHCRFGETRRRPRRH